MIVLIILLVILYIAGALQTRYINFIADQDLTPEERKKDIGIGWLITITWPIVSFVVLHMIYKEYKKRKNQTNDQIKH